MLCDFHGFQKEGEPSIAAPFFVVCDYAHDKIFFGNSFADHKSKFREIGFKKLGWRSGGVSDDGPPPSPETEPERVFSW